MLMVKRLALSEENSSGCHVGGGPLTSCLWDGIRQFPHEVAYVNLRAKGVAYGNSTCLEFSPVYYKCQISQWQLQL